MSSNAQDEALSRSSPLRNKVAVVSGASRGIGRAIALQLGLMGASVAICARKHEEIERTAASFRDEGIKALPIVADVTLEGDVERLIERASEEFGEIEVLVNKQELVYLARFMSAASLIGTQS